MKERAQAAGDGMNENTGGIHIHERSAGLHERHHGKPCNRDRGARFRVLAQQWGCRTDYRRGVPHHASHQGPRLSDGNKRIAIMPALTLLGMKIRSRRSWLNRSRRQSGVFADRVHRLQRHGNRRIRPASSGMIAKPTKACRCCLRRCSAFFPTGFKPMR